MVVNETERTLSPPHNYSRHMDSLQQALAVLANKSIADNVTIVLAAGEHRLDSKVVINGSKRITIVSEDGDRGKARINASAANGTTVTEPPTAIVSFVSSSHVLLSNLTVEMLTEGTVFDFIGCVGVTVRNCQFTTRFSVSTALNFTNTVQLNASGCVFLFDVPVVDKDADAATPLRKTKNATLFFFVIVNDSETPFNSDLDTTGQLAMSMSNCRFMSKSKNDALEMAGYGGIGEYRSSPLQQEALLVVLIYGPNAQGLNVNISHCYVSGLLFGLAVPIALVIENGASGNSITLTNSQITDNICISGCGILVWFSNQAAGNVITVSDTVFTNNTAEVEGGAIFALLEDVNGVDNGNVLSIDRCNFVNNRADTLFGGGSSVMIYSNRELGRSGAAGTFQEESRVEFSNCIFENNTAERAAVYTKDTDVTFAGNWFVLSLV